jgi:hypothetical protein
MVEHLPSKPKKSRKIKSFGDYAIETPVQYWWELKNSTAAVENRMVVPQKFFKKSYYQ